MRFDKIVSELTKIRTRRPPPRFEYSGLTKSGQNKQAADSTDSTARQRRTGLNLIHYKRHCQIENTDNAHNLKPHPSRKNGKSKSET
ncbi:hypothetical protein [Neisseria meningitidis]|uniref:hypothetical protein n=1 Tax=Neisseria meningitidis TaxID=487 RepID=UPI000A3D8C5F|nr:hypothetical protein [Neisseria meningitidis]